MIKGVGALLAGSVIAAGLAACSLTEDDRDEMAEQVYGYTWVAEEVAGSPAAPGVESNLVVAPDGRVSGNAGCNRYFGSVIIDGEAMSFGNLGSTKMACPGPAMSQEVSLLRALDGTRGYRLDGGSLMLLDGKGGTLVRFRQEESI